MASTRGLKTTCLGPHVIVTRILTFLLSILSLSFWAYTLSIYNSRIAPTDGLAALDDRLLTINSVPIVPLTISIFWTIINLTIFFRRVSGGEGDPSRPLVHPYWVVGIDGLIWVFMLVMEVVASKQLNRWHSGDEDWGIGGHVHVNLADCPIINPTTGLLEYYCTKDWKNLMQMEVVALSLMGTAFGIHFFIFCYAVDDLKWLRRRCRAEGPCRRHAVGPAVTNRNTAPPSTFSNKFEGHVELSRLSANDGVKH